MGSEFRPVDLNFARPADRSRATRAKVDARTRELAALAGRAAPHVTQADYQQAKRELTGETDLKRQAAILDFRPPPTIPPA